MPEPRLQPSSRPALRPCYTKLPPERPGPPRRRKRRRSEPPLHWTDRLICAAFGGLLGLVTAAIWFAIAMYHDWMNWNGFLASCGITVGSFWIVGGAATGLAAALSGMAGPERMMDAFTWVWDRWRIVRGLRGEED